MLVGTESRELMAGAFSLKTRMSRQDGEVWLLNAHISHYSHGNLQNHDPERTRKLLLHKKRSKS